MKALYRTTDGGGQRALTLIVTDYGDGTVETEDFIDQWAVRNVVSFRTTDFMGLWAAVEGAFTRREPLRDNGYHVSAWEVEIAELGVELLRAARAAFDLARAGRLDEAYRVASPVIEATGAGTAYARYVIERTAGGR